MLCSLKILCTDRSEMDSLCSGINLLNFTQYLKKMLSSMSTLVWFTISRTCNFAFILTEHNYVLLLTLTLQDLNRRE